MLQAVFYLFWSLSPEFMHNRICDIISWLWPPYLAFWTLWSPIVVSGDVDKKGRVPNNEKAFVIVNHRSYMDWLAIMALGNHSGITGNFKIMVKQSVAWLPILGWSFKMMQYVFLARTYDQDSSKLQRIFSFLSKVRRPFWLMSHLEGTRLTSEKLSSSQDFSKLRKLPVLKHTLLPRVKGFIGAMQQLRGNLDCIYDITIMHPDGYPSLWRCWSGTETRSTHLYVRKIAMSELPDVNDEEALKTWVYNLYYSKDQLLEYFAQHGCFPDTKSSVLPSLMKIRTVSQSSLSDTEGTSEDSVPPQPSSKSNGNAEKRLSKKSRKTN